MSDQEIPIESKSDSEPEGITEQDVIEYAEAIKAETIEELEFDKFVTEANVARYRAQTTRLAVLSNFAFRQIAKMGAWMPSDATEVDTDQTPAKVLRAREHCIITVLQAIAKIAKESHVLPERGKKVTENSAPNGTEEDDVDVDE
jgi:hypothetical protein